MKQPERMRLPRIDELAKQRGFTQREVAEMSGLSVNQINRIVNGISVPSVETLMKLSKILGASIDYILELTDDPIGHFNPSELSSDEQNLILDIRNGNILDLLYRIAINEELREKLERHKSSSK